MFGEAPDANDGPPADTYDIVKPPAPPTPYIRTWLNDNLPVPFDLLWKDYRHYSGASKVWNLTVQWMPTSGSSASTITMSWSLSEFSGCEYTLVNLCTESGTSLMNMLTNNNYVFSCPAYVPQNFKIICSTPLNQPPVFGTPSPVNNSTGNSLSFSWGIPINDLEGNFFSWSIQCSNGQTNSGIDASSGTKSLALSGLAYSTTYKVWVNATDPTGSGLYTRRWYTFTTQASGSNNPPVFGAPSPTNGSTGNLLSFSWSISISDPEGNLFSWTIQCSNGQTNTATGATNGTKSLMLSGLAYSKTYTVWVNATDPTGSGLYIRKWYSFTTQQQQNVPPNKPTTPSGETSGKFCVSYVYESYTTDIDGDQIYYLFDWGDGKDSGWIGPYDSGDVCQESHIWSIKGSYSIKVKAKDVSGAESQWSDSLPITMPYSYDKSILQFLSLLFQRLPNTFPLIRQLLGY
jgi:hypothetical protein